jgi:PIN domain nuclease of toxin-antitoxin system
MGGCRGVSLIVLDTHVWLWLEAAPDRLSVPTTREIERADRLGVCTVSCWELAMLVARGRIELDRPVGQWIGAALARERVEPLGLSPDAALAAAALPLDRFPRDPADRCIYSSTRLAGGYLVTRDRQLRTYDVALTIW